MLMIPPVAPPPYTALAPDITSMRSMLNGSMESNCRLMPRELFSDTPSIITSTLRPRRFWPLLVRPWEPISRPGINCPNASFSGTPAWVCWSSCSRSITQTVPGNSLMLVGAREPITTICCSTGSAASAGAENEAKRDRESARGAGRKGMERGMRRFPSCCCFDGRQS